MAKGGSPGKKTYILPREKTGEIVTSDNSLELAKKGHFIVYTTNKVQFAFPIAYLNSSIFRELLRMSEEEFGLAGQGPITLPCDSQFMGYVASLMQKKADKDVENALLLSMAALRCSSSSSYYLDHQQTSHNMLLCGC
ncbi:hypothetical protein CDL12_16913 [Handroanthus impetiginosus]|uniref:Small auxin-up RNA n=1 Tax=Handroanthus impetiginosus TaxID=429701 RepID=A0A2G9GYZ1_9LAMI|nr:hypothetical protein CDL12_16913 [Handroanthus impetiginosus]